MGVPVPLGMSVPDREAGPGSHAAPGEVETLDTLGGRYPIVGSPAAEKRALARAQSYNYITGGLCGALALALPHPAGWDEPALIPFVPLAVAVGLILFRWADRFPMPVLAALPGLATMMTTAVIALSDSALSPFALFYLWVAFYAIYFLSRPVALAHLAFIALNCAAVWLALGVPDLAARHGVAADVPYLVVGVATAVMAGILFRYLRHRLGVLVGTLAEAAQTDLVTGLPNAKAFRSAVEAEIARAAPAGRAVSVVLVDVDRLGKLNDALGHDGADRLVLKVGEAIRETQGPGQTVARIGAGTFGVVMPEADRHAALLAAEDLLTTVRRGFRAQNRPGVTLSAGIAAFPQDEGDAETLLSAADRALDAAKVLGRDRAVVASPELDVLSGSRPSVDDTLAHLKTLLSLAEALDLRDPHTAEHAQHVGELCEHIARELGLSEPRVVRIRLAGILHDIGKVGVPDEILFSDGSLDPEQWERMKRHPEIGARILGSSELSDIREWVLASHERPDGKGYPRGLEGGDIPLEARIIYVADAWETMTTDRTYRLARGEGEARQELRDGAGTEFDAEVVEALFSVLDQGVVAAESMQ
jgi:diguanylate cyclase (GGDEF)-like protein/putative nucleotidyltransferase with HDIG domain